MAKETAGYKAKDMAEALEIDPRELRGHLRALEIEKPEAGWVWPSAKAASDVLKAVKERIKSLASKPKAEKPAKSEKPAKAEKPAKGKKSKAEDVPSDEGNEESPKGKGKKKKAAK